jgi:hypothetical protein
MINPFVTDWKEKNISNNSACKHLSQSYHDACKGDDLKNMSTNVNHCFKGVKDNINKFGQCINMRLEHINKCVYDVDDGHVGQINRLRHLYETCSKNTPYKEKLREFEKVLEETNPDLYAAYKEEVLQKEAARIEEYNLTNESKVLDDIIKQANDYNNRCKIKADQIFYNNRELNDDIRKNVIHPPKYAQGGRLFKDSDRYIIKVKDAAGKYTHVYLDTLERMIPKTTYPYNYFLEITVPFDGPSPPVTTIDMSDETKRWYDKIMRKRTPKLVSADGWSSIHDSAPAAAAAAAAAAAPKGTSASKTKPKQAKSSNSFNVLINGDDDDTDQEGSGRTRSRRNRRGTRNRRGSGGRRGSRRYSRR